MKASSLCALGIERMGPFGWKPQIEKKGEKKKGRER
jgi:hypothetical protein